MKFKVYEVDARMTGTGKELKKLVLQGEGKQYPDKNVTMWSDHPLFESITPGQEIEAELKVEDSQTPNPKGGFYKNKTLLKPGQSAPAPLPQGTGDTARLENAINLKLIPAITRIEAALDRLQAITGFVAGDAPEPKPIKAEWDGQMPNFGEDEDVTKNSPF